MTEAAARLTCFTASFFMAAILFGTPAKAEELVSGLSTDLIQITSNFNGTDIVLFGAIEASGEATANKDQDLVVVIRGPPVDMTVRRKERTFGIWINREEVQLSGMPGYYFLASTRPLDDIASLTKVVATTTLVAKLVEGDFPVPLDLDAKVERYLPEWTAGANRQDLEWRDRVTVRHLLTHTSGLPPFKEYWRTSKSKQETLSRIFAEPLDYEPGTKEVYSDLGIILMAEIIERLTGRKLDDLARSYIFSTLGMNDTTFRPAKNLWPGIAPTEFDRNLRNRLVQGEVHDENAFTMGGVSGHAGVFSTAPDLAAFCQMLLNGGVYAHRRILKRATIAQFTTPQPLSNRTRTLGWAVPTEGSSSGHYFSNHSFGHTGFTGTSIWIDPDRQLFVVLLTNRVNPTRENQKIAQVRPAVHDALMQALGFATPAVPAR